MADTRSLFKVARKRAGLTQRELAAMIGQEPTWVSHRETGHVSYSLEDAKLLAEALDLKDSEWTRLRFTAAVDAA